MLEVGEGGTFCCVIADVFEEKGFVCLPVEPAYPSIGSGFSEKAIEAPGEKVAYASASTKGFYDTIFDEPGDPGLEMVRYGKVAMDGVENEEIFSGKQRCAFGSDFFQEAKELGILDVSTKCEPNGVVVGM